MRARLGACPVVDQSSDAAASACLAGTYVGKTLTNAECKLIIEASGNYQRRLGLGKVVSEDGQDDTEAK